MTVQFLQLVWSHWHGSRATHIPDPFMSADSSTAGWEMDLAASGGMLMEWEGRSRPTR